MQNNKLSKSLFEGTHIADSSKSHHDISISWIFLQSSDQLDMKNVCQILEILLWYSNTLEIYPV